MVIGYQVTGRVRRGSRSEFLRNSVTRSNSPSAQETQIGLQKKEIIPNNRNPFSALGYNPFSALGY
jgi:hypothetical protein